MGCRVLCPSSIIVSPESWCFCSPLAIPVHLPVPFLFPPQEVPTFSPLDLVDKEQAPVSSWPGWGENLSCSGEVPGLGAAPSLGDRTRWCFGSVLYCVREEGTLVIAWCSSGQCGTLSGGVADLLEGLQPPKILPPGDESFLGKAAG